MASQKIGLERESSLEPLEEISAAVDRFCSVFSLMSSSRAEAMHIIVSEMHALSYSIARVESRLSSEVLRKALAPAIEVHGESPFVERLQTWPRGYPGDFETIEYLVAGAPRLDPTHRAYWLEWYALNTAVGQQHRNKIKFQADQIRSSALRARPSELRVASVGCGGAADFQVVKEVLPQTSVTLIDIDAKALELATERCSGASDLKVFQGDALRVLRSIKSDFDLILFGGLFDYLPDRYIISLLRLASRSLRPDGCIVFTNLADGNPFRPWLEHIAAWNMVERTSDQVRDLCVNAGIEPDRLTIDLDGTGLTLLVVVS